ncbi:MAG TPA: GTPase [Candidatus Limnocylindria bacterium]|nr:GTPase [Candidatus Limnocylindria bacterium]
MTLEKRLERLGAAADAAAGIGLDGPAHAAREVVETARRRVGFPGDVYVLALAGGTGVGKSSILNALAGRTVSAVRAVRPTTDEPVAWVASDRVDELRPLLEWLGVRHVASHADERLSGVAILDLPDVDSVRTEHRAAVDALLPRIDAVAWVVDPEKYDDERLHQYLRSLAPHAARLRFVLNKTDRLTEADRGAVASDLERRLAADAIMTPRIDAVSAATGDGMDGLRQALAGAADAKAVVIDKLSTDVAAAATALGRAAAVDRADPDRRLVPEERERAAIDEAVEGALAVVDPPGLARQVQAAVLGRARRTGGSLLGRVVGLLGWMTGQQRRRADPAGYLRDWRRRGSLGRVVNPVHRLLVEAAAALPPASRPAVLAALGAADLEAETARVLDRVSRDAAGEVRIGGSWLWLPIGAVQLVVGAIFVFAVAWYVTLFVSGGSVPVATIEVPVLGPVPLPLVLLAGSVIVSAVLGLILSLHAGWLGRRQGRRLASRVREAVEVAVREQGLAGLHRVEAARAVIAASVLAE